jgi:hypothetical protein
MPYNVTIWCITSFIGLSLNSASNEIQKEHSLKILY